MNLKRAIEGPILSLIFLLFFTYMIFGLQWIIDNSFQTTQNNMFLGSVSDGLQDFMLENVIGDTILTEDTGPEVNAKAVISVESNLQDINKILFEENSSIQLPIASLTKLMTAVVVLDNYNLSDAITVSKIADSQESVKQDVKLGDTMPVESFLDIMLVASSNKAAYVLSEGMFEEKKFVDLMNQKAKSLGLKNTFFADPTGLSPYNVSTASDLVKLAEYILRDYPKIANISKVNDFYVPNFGNITNTNQLLSEVPEVICSKTGFTAAAKGCLLLVMRPKGCPPNNKDYFISVILGADDRFTEMKKLIDWQNTACK